MSRGERQQWGSQSIRVEVESSHGRECHVVSRFAADQRLGTVETLHLHAYIAAYLSALLILPESDADHWGKGWQWQWQ